MALSRPQPPTNPPALAFFRRSLSPRICIIAARGARKFISPTATRRPFISPFFNEINPPRASRWLMSQLGAARVLHQTTSIFGRFAFPFSMQISAIIANNARLRTTCRLPAG